MRFIKSLSATILTTSLAVPAFAFDTDDQIGLDTASPTYAIEVDATRHLMRIELDQHCTIFGAASHEFADIPLPNGASQ